MGDVSSFGPQLNPPYDLPPLDITIERTTAEYGDTTYDELVLKISESRAKGPKELPPEPYFVSDTLLPIELTSSSYQPSSPYDLSLDTLLSPRPFQTRSKSTSPRRFQNLLQRDTQPISPAIYQDDSDCNQTHSQPVSPESHNSLPYPLEEYTYSDEEYNTPDMSRYLEIKDQMQDTPTRIPSLHGQELLQRPSIEIPVSGGARNQSSDLYFMHSSPPLFQTSFTSSPELPFRRTRTSASSSPSRYTGNRRSSVDLFSPVSDSRSSPASSPKRSSFMNQGLDDDYLDYQEDRYPEWSLIEHDETEYCDDILYSYSRDNDFDFAALPELPKVSLHRKTSSDALSSFISKQIPSQPPLDPSYTAKKFGELPPVPMDLPSLVFSASSLTPSHFLECANVWSLKAISRWCIKFSGWINDQEILARDFEKVLTRLLLHHKPDVSVDVIESNVKHLIVRLSESGLLQKVSGTEGESSNLTIHASDSTVVSGVLVGLCPCYCIDEESSIQNSGCCYSWLCPVNKRVAHEKLMSEAVPDDIVLGSDWANHWNLTAQEISIDPSGSKKQSLLFDLIKFEQTFLKRATCFIEVAGPEFIKVASLLLGQSSVISILKLKEEIFSSAKKLAELHHWELLNPLKNILIVDGKFIRDVKGMSELYYSWSKAAQKPLLEYMGILPIVEDLLKNESLKGWDINILNDPQLKEQQVNGNILLISTFNSRYQQLPLQLLDVRKFYDEGDEEYIALTRAIDSIKDLGLKVNEKKVHADNVHLLKQIEKHLQWKPSIFQVNLKLSSPNRKFYYRGDLTRKGDLKINSTAVHVIVLDNYLVITEKQRYHKTTVFKVTETPIPIDYLLFENRDSDSAVIANGANPVLSTDAAEDSTYPFKIRYAGRGKGQTHTLIASSEAERKKWLTVLLQSRNGAVKKQSSLAPFSIEAIDNSFFAYDQASRVAKLPILASNDPLMVITKNTKERLRERKVGNDIYRPSITKGQLLFTQISYSETFVYQNETFVFVGLNTGIFCSDGKNIWKKIVNLSNVTKITVIPELSVVLVLANKELRYYPLKSIIDIYYERKERLSSFVLTNGSILFYEFGRHREVPALFVARKKNSGTTTFKVFALETDNHGILSTFAVIKRFYIQAECYGVSIFNTSIAVHTNRGLEILDLDKLVPRTVPELPPPDASSKKLDAYSRKKEGSGTDQIRKALTHTTPMGMYKLSNNKEFLLVYTDCAIFVNKNGKLSRKTMISFDGKPRSSAFQNNYLILACEEIVEVWSISDFTSGSNSLVQVIPCRDIQMINPKTLEFQSVNPRIPGIQLLFRMVQKAAEKA